MTNETIIMNASFALMEDGILKGSGVFGKTEDGTEVEFPEAIHTYNTWKRMGRQVKRGEKAIAKIRIWKCSTKTVTAKTVDGNEHDEDVRRMFMKDAFFFTAEQTEAVTK